MHRPVHGFSLPVCSVLQLTDILLEMFCTGIKWKTTSFFLASLSWNVWSCVRRRGESAASSPSGSFVQAAPSADSTPKGTPLRSRKSNPQAEDQDFGRE